MKGKIIDTNNDNRKKYIGYEGNISLGDATFNMIAENDGR